MDLVLLFADKGRLLFSGAIRGIAASCTWKNAIFSG